MSELGFQTSGRVRHRRGRGCVAVLLALAVIGGLGAVAVIKGRALLSDVFSVPDYTGSGQGQVVVQVEQGESSTDIADTLERKGVVKSAEAFTRAARNDSRALSIQPGYYRLREQMAAKNALGLLLDPDARIMDRVTVPEGRRVSQIVSILSDKTKIPESEFEQALKDPSSLGLPKYARGKAEGMLFPATYDVDPGTTAASLLSDMAKRHNQVSAQLGLTDSTAQSDFDPLQVVTVASLVEAEARRPADFPKVARVIYNRVAKNQRLQLDSTVHYAINRYDTPSTTRAERANPSPYNTYVHPGLPPGPINSPGERALRAAIHPAEGSWMYFVTVNPDTGETKFATTLAEHERYVRQFQSWCRTHSDRC